MFDFKKRQSVLVIEDDHVLINLITHRLTRHEKLRVISAVSGANGIKAAIREHPDLILLDWGLSDDLSGFDVLQNLKDDPDTCDIPVVMMTARNRVGEIEDCLANGAVDYLTKPVRLSEISEKIRQVL
ncbi:MAG: response regulator [Rhodospirillales bacterium]|jgi:CheY-like chemotaxis protein|nr:response regulator [Rhodospirillales bacterium]